MKRNAFEIYQGKNKLWYWRFRAKNGKITADTQGYKYSQGADRAIQRHIFVILDQNYVVKFISMGRSVVK